MTSPAQPIADEEALQVARMVNWYEPPDEVVANRPLFLAQIMARGTLGEMAWMQGRYSVEEQRDAYVNAPAGLFHKEAWAYWGLALLGDAKARPYPRRHPDMPETPGMYWPG